MLVQAQSQKGDDAYALGVEGIQLIDDGQFDIGIKLLKKAQGLEPQDYDYTFEIGKAYLKNGNPKKAEKYLFDLQYHVSAQADLYLALSSCYAELEELKKAPNPERKKELDALRYGIQKLPSEAILISNSLKVVSGKNWRADPEKLDQDFKFVFSENCATISNESGLELENRKCLLENWKYDSFTISPLFQRVAELESKGWLEAYLATILQENDKEKFLEWLPENVKDFEEYRTWRYWNPIKLMKPINRL